MTVFLIGFMGAGKTTIGKKLAAKFSLTFVDVDAVLEQIEGKYIRDIIADGGEGYFRERESAVLRGLDIADKLISTGGGTPCFYDNMAWMNGNGITVFINADEGVIYSRLLTTNRENRPLLKGLSDAELRDFVRTKLGERMPVYSQAHISIDPIKSSIADIALAISEYIKG